MSWWPWGKKNRQAKIDWNEPHKLRCRLTVTYYNTIQIKTRKHKDGIINKGIRYSDIEEFEDRVKLLDYYAIKGTIHDDCQVVIYGGHMGLKFPKSFSPHIKIERNMCRTYGVDFPGKLIREVV